MWMARSILMQRFHLFQYFQKYQQAIQLSFISNTKCLEFTLLICYKFKYKRYTLRIRLYTFRHTYEKLRNDTRHKEPYFSTREFISWQLRLVNIQKSGPKDFANGGTLKCTKQSITRNISYWHEKKKISGYPIIICDIGRFPELKFSLDYDRFRILFR